MTLTGKKPTDRDHASSGPGSQTMTSVVRGSLEAVKEAVTTRLATMSISGSDADVPVTAGLIFALMMRSQVA